MSDSSDEEIYLTPTELTETENGFCTQKSKSKNTLSSLSHGKRSDKETQSPMLKIFKDMMQKDKRSDPEKTNLLEKKHQDRKRKHYSGSRSKLGRTVSSSSEHAKNDHYKIQEKTDAEFDASQHTLPFQSEKRESWWFCGDTDAKKTDADDTCSCVSCALKKLISTDYACIACVTIMLVVSVIIAIMLVYKNIPCNANIERRMTAKNIKTESERLKRKIGGLEKLNFVTKKQWRNIFKRDGDLNLGSIGSSGNDMSSLVESENELSKILDSDKMSDIQHSDRLRDFYKKLIQTDAAIRNLRKTFNDNTYTSTNNFDFNNNFDINNNYDINNIDFNNKANLDIIDSDRLKRSINFHPRNLFYFKRRETTTESKISKGKLITKTTINMTSNKKPNGKDSKPRNKRFGNFSDGFIIEKNKVMIQYKPRVVPKCSHSPIDTKSHEKELAHPFYKNTQRLDQLLDQFIDKKLPDLLADRLGFGMLFENNKNKKCKHPVNQEVIVVKDDDIRADYDQKDQGTDENQKDDDSKDYANPNNMNQNNHLGVGTSKSIHKEELTTAKTYVVAKDEPNIASKDVKQTANVFENDFFEDSDGVEKKTLRSSTGGGYDILLSISTLVNPAVRTTSKSTTPFAERPNLRKLLQTNMKAEDGVAYEDLKEVLADYKEGHDDEDKDNDRKKRNENTRYDTQVKIDEIKQIPTGVHNPNWKGPMPLYPDEITQMAIKSRSAENKVKIPVHNRETVPETDDVESIKSDVEYVKDYLDNGYERLVELAQAYSDYGVLNEKKVTTVDKKATDKDGNETVRNRKAGISKRLKNSFKRGLKSNRDLFDKIKQGSELSEGIRIELKPNPKGSFPLDDSGFNLRELFNKHVKWSGAIEKVPTVFNSATDVSTNVQVSGVEIPITDKIKANKDYDPNSNVIYKKRTLKSYSISNIYDKKLDSFESSSELQFDIDAQNEKDINKAKDTNTLPDIKLRYGNVSKRSIDVLESKIYNTTLNNNTNDLFKTKSEAKVNKTIRNTDSADSNMSESTLSNFFLLLSNWFSAMDKTDIGEKNISKVIPSNQNIKVKKQSNLLRTPETQQAYPEYDSDMIENIGHRSRVLLSIEATNNTEKAEDHVTSEGEGRQISKMPSSTEPMNIANATRSQQVTTESLKNVATALNETNNRMVKRQAIDDSNLIFWNDLYDEEYGINADSIESDIRDKHSVQKNDLMKKSNTWIHDKVKMITDKFYPGSGKKGSKTKLHDRSKHSKRNIIYDSDEDDDTQKLDLAALTERMKEVCKETVRAVQETNHIQVREDNKESQAATSLMQQLVRLMTDLVDFQVQERTCRRLPPDLQTFLEWLTSSKQEDQDPNTESYFKDKDNVDPYAIDFAKKIDKSTEQDLLQPSERENTDSKTDCLGTLHAVQNLIREYEDMNEDDKSVMTGVKDYLENQMHFLQRQLSSIDDLKYYNRGSRFRRDVITNFGQTVSESIDDTAKQLEKQYKTLRNMYHKYKNKIGPAYKEAVKTTDEINKAVTHIVHKVYNPKVKADKHIQKSYKHQKPLKINDKNKYLHKKEKAKVKNHRHAFFRKTKSKSKDNFGYANNINFALNKDNLFGINMDQALDKDQRNIKDVYFKAVEEAKKSSLAKGAHRRDSNTFDKKEIYKINDYEDEKYL